MKRKVVIVAGLLTLGVVAYISSRLTAQQTARPAAAPQTRIALINLTYVIKNYHKYLSFQNTIRGQVKEWEDKIAKKKRDAEGLAKELQSPTVDAARKVAIEKDLKRLQREGEDLQMEARRVIAKQGSEQMVIIYREVRETAQRHAMAHNFDLVLHYDDATTKEDYDSAGNINRKIQSSGLIPMYWNQGMDISYEILTTLNKKYAGGAPKE